MENKYNWWDKLGKPQYGGEMVIRLNRKIVNFDPYFGYHLTQIHTAWLEKMFVTIGRWRRKSMTTPKTPSEPVGKRSFGRNLGIYRPIHIRGSFTSRDTLAKYSASKRP